MLPADVLGTTLGGELIRKGEPEQIRLRRAEMRTVVVSYLTSTLVCILAVAVCYRVLLLLNFSIIEATAGALSLLFGTTFLHYTQNLTENNCIFLLTITGVLFTCKWRKTGSRGSLLLGSVAIGANLLTRLTTVFDLLAVALLVWYSLRDLSRPDRRGKFLQYCFTVAPVYSLFLLLDRLYQHYRFGSFLNTYMQIFAVQARKFDPTLPSSFPFNGSFGAGFWGALLSPEKSVFLFDPLLILSALAAVFLWRVISTEVKAYVVAASFLLLAEMCFYAKYFVWSGDYAWGDRYLATSAQLLAVIAVPTVIRYRKQLPKALWISGLALLTASIIIQLSSVMFRHHLEIYQMMTMRRPVFVIGLRFKNILASVVHKTGVWGLQNDYCRQDLDNFPYMFPFLALRRGSASIVVRFALLAQWFFCLFGLIFCLMRIFGVMRGHWTVPGTSAQEVSAVPNRGAGVEVC